MLEERSLPSGGSPYATYSSARFWDATSGSNASNTANWDVGKLGSHVHPDVAPGNDPGNSQGIIFDGTAGYGGNQNCTWDYTPDFGLGSVTFQNGWTQTVSFLDKQGFSAFGNVEVTGSSAPTITPSGKSGANAVPAITLTGGAQVSVAFGSTLFLQGYGGGNAIFFAGDGTAGEFLNNNGTVVYLGVGNESNDVFDYLKIPVQNNSVFKVDGNIGDSNFGSGLQVSGADAGNTNNVSFYQTKPTAETDLSGSGTLWCTNNYTMNAGLLQTTDSADTNVLKVGTGGSSPVDGTVTLLGGTVNIDANPNAYGTLQIMGTTDTNAPTLNLGGVTLNFNVNMTEGKNDCSKLIVGKTNGTGKVNFGYGGYTTTVAINPQGQTTTGHKWQIIFFGSATGTNSISLSPAIGYSRNWVPTKNPTILEIDN